MATIAARELTQLPARSVTVRYAKRDGQRPGIMALSRYTSARPEAEPRALFRRYAAGGDGRGLCGPSRRSHGNGTSRFAG
jgi:hypothetical protein